jgi:hypothetical protein
MKSLYSPFHDILVILFPGENELFDGRMNLKKL